CRTPRTTMKRTAGWRSTRRTPWARPISVAGVSVVLTSVRQRRVPEADRPVAASGVAGQVGRPGLHDRRVVEVDVAGVVGDPGGRLGVDLLACIGVGLAAPLLEQLVDLG